MKETYYFSHDYNPTNDPKIICLIGNYGGLGYGVYWRIIEMLHQECENKLPLKLYIYEAIAKQMLASAKQIEAIINDCFKFELFQKDNEYFWSNRVLRNIEKRQEISEKRREAGKAGNKVKQMLASAKQIDAKKRKEKEIKLNKKEKEIKLNKIDIVPSEQVQLVIPNLVEDKQKHIQIIGLYARAKKVLFETKEQQSSFIKRNLKSAQNLVGYEFTKIANTMKYLIDNADYKWTLETVGKYIDEDLNNIKTPGIKDEDLIKKILNS